jgi:MraZ protein
MLIGEYIHTIDEKNRISLPVKFRKEMGKSIVVAPGLDNCLFLFTIKGWEKFSEHLSSDTSLMQADNRSFNRYMFGQATQIDVDSLGRILIPDILKNKVGLSQKAAVVGVQNRVEIWNESAWNKYKKVVEKEADALAEKLGKAGII